MAKKAKKIVKDTIPTDKEIMKLLHHPCVLIVYDKFQIMDSAYNVIKSNYPKFKSELQKYA